MHLHELDLSSQSSVHACAQELATSLTRIDVLINNAGVRMEMIVMMMIMMRNLAHGRHLRGYLAR